MERKYPPFETLERIKKWCDLQERAHSEVLRKLRSWGVPIDEAQDLSAELILENYLNEERFARAYARGKSRLKKWGWQKIKVELRKRQVSESIINLAKDEIDQDEVKDQLKSLLEKKKILIRGKSPQDKKNKLLRYALNKGYSYEEIREVLDELE